MNYLIILNKPIVYLSSIPILLNISENNYSNYIFKNIIYNI